MQTMMNLIYALIGVIAIAAFGACGVGVANPDPAIAECWVIRVSVFNAEVPIQWDQRIMNVMENSVDCAFKTLFSWRFW